MTDSTAPITSGRVEVLAKIERATGEVEHLKLIDGKWVPCEPEKELKHGTDDQGH